eukprot:403339196
MLLTITFSTFFVYLCLFYCESGVFEQQQVRATTLPSLPLTPYVPDPKLSGRYIEIKFKLYSQDQLESRLHPVRSRISSLEDNNSMKAQQSEGFFSNTAQLDQETCQNSYNTSRNFTPSEQPQKESFQVSGERLAIIDDFLQNEDNELGCAEEFDFSNHKKSLAKSGFPQQQDNVQSLDKLDVCNTNLTQEKEHLSIKAKLKLSYDQNQKLLKDKCNEILISQNKIPLEILSKIYQSSHVSKQQRAAIADWMMQFCSKYNISRASIYLALTYFDDIIQLTFALNRSLHQQDLEAYAVMCLFIACKLQDSEPPSLIKFCQSVQQTNTMEMLREAEIEILKLLKFKLLRVTLQDQLDQYLSQLQALHNISFTNLQVTNLLHYLDLLSLDPFIRSLDYPTVLNYLLSLKLQHTQIQTLHHFDICSSTLESLERYNKVFEEIEIKEIQSGESEDINLVKYYKIGRQDVFKIILNSQ